MFLFFTRGLTIPGESATSRQLLNLVFGILCCCTLLANQAAATKLIDIIPGLYGGDGISLATAPAASHTAHFSINSLASINRLNQQIAAEIGTFPFSSSVGGFAFEFDPSIGDFVTTSKTLGPLIAEPAATQGRGKFNFNLSYTFLKYNEFSSQSLSRFGVIARHNPDIVGFPDTREQFEQDILRIRMDLDIRLKILALSTTYGLTDRLYIGFLLPYAQVDLDLRSDAQVVQSDANTLFSGIHSFTDGPEAAADRATGSASGLGDVLFRAKYHILQNDQYQLAGTALVQLGTTDNKDFLGTGETALRPFLVVSRSFTKHYTPHLNIGYEFNLDTSGHSALEYSAGFDAGNNRYTLAGEFIGSHQTDGDGIGDDILDTAWGVKWNPAGCLLLALNTQFPLNDAGLRSKSSSTFSIEYGF